MGDSATWMRFVAAALATWRVSHLIAFEDGPWDAIARTRRWVGGGFFGRLMDCFYCVSLWVAAPLVLLFGVRWQDAIMLWLAISGAACLLDRIGHDPVTIKTLDERGNSEDAVLRTASDEREASRKRAGSGAG
jgi:hypothetical protein